MPCGTWKTTDVPTSEVNRVIFNYNLDGPISVTKEPQGPDLWTVIAVFEDCPAGEENETVQSHNG